MMQDRVMLGGHAQDLGYVQDLEAYAYRASACT